MLPTMFGLGNVHFFHGTSGRKTCGEIFPRWDLKSVCLKHRLLSPLRRRGCSTSANSTLEIRLRPAGRNRVGRSRNWPKSNRWCLLCFFFFSFFFSFVLFFFYFSFPSSCSYSSHSTFCFQPKPRTLHPKPSAEQLSAGQPSAGPSCETPAASVSLGLHTTTQELQTCTFQGPGTKRPQERERRKKIVAGEGKNAKFWGPHPSGPPPFGNWLKLKLVEVEIGRSRIGRTRKKSWPKSKLAEVDRASFSVVSTYSIRHCFMDGMFDLSTVLCGIVCATCVQRFFAT